MSTKRLMDYVGSIEQLAYARAAELTDGAGRGNRVIDVCNGSGLQFTVCPDRGLDIVEASFNGVPVAYRTPNGHCTRLEYQQGGINWLRTWPGGLMTTCGLRSAGNPNGEFGLHGRASNSAAEDVSVVREWAGGEYRIVIRGVLREARIFGENIRMVRTLSTAYGKNAIEVHDEITNLAYAPDYVQLVYHCNFGYPLVSPGMKLVAAKHDVTPRTPEAAAGLATWDVMPPPRKGTPEQCFFHAIPAGKDGFASMSIVNAEAGVKATVAYDTRTLPRLVQWKAFDVGAYVTGLEPSNTWLKGREGDVADGTAQKIGAGETLGFTVRFQFEGL
ncbi:MAG: aldose 1-epimerase family protein [Kiritimatiellaeota bacterium]|nr:aldose 1-epimerase family protein [Kiritimatiellota bacterium]